jgi:hypothetical protein
MRTLHVAAVAACAVAGAAGLATTGAAGPPPPAPASAAAASIVGRWERTITCRGLVRALRRHGLGPTAPAIIAGNGYVPGTPKQLARRRHLCKGAVARRHSHFFRADGQFGSVDYDNNQVDDGPWALTDRRTLRIGSPPNAGGTFRMRIRDGRLHLRPLISAAQKRRALAHPLQFSSAGWMVAVSYPGHAWKRVSCSRWC